MEKGRTITSHPCRRAFPSNRNQLCGTFTSICKWKQIYHRPMDYLTKWPEARATKEATADETVKFIYENIICRHRCPGKILSDRGTHFNNQLLTKLIQKFQIQHLMLTPYHPQTNGLVERFNRTLIEG